MHGWEFMAWKDCFKTIPELGGLLIKAGRLEDYDDEDIARHFSNNNNNTVIYKQTEADRVVKRCKNIG